MDENLKQKVKKFLPIIISVAVMLVIVITTLIFTLGRQTNNEKIIGLTFDPDKPIPVEQNNLYGYISASNGKELISPKYSDANAFYGNYAIVELEENNSIKYCIIDKKGNTKLSSESRIKFISEYGLYIIDDRLYNENLKAITDDNMDISYRDFGYSSYIKYDKDNNATEGGIVDNKGKKVYSYKFENSESFFSCTISEADERLKENYAKVNVENKKYAIVNLENGKVLYDYTDKSINVEDDNIFEISSNGTVESILCFANNKIVYETSEKIEISYYDIENRILQLYNRSADYSSRYSYYDLNKKSLLNEKPSKEEISSIESLTGYKSFTSNNKHGVMKGEKMILSCDYDDIEFLSPLTFNYIKTKNNEELVLAKSGNTYNLINLKNQKTVFSFKCSNVNTYSSSTFIKAKLSDTKETCVYNLLTGKSLTFDSNSQVSIYSNYIIVSKDNHKTYYNTKLKEIYNK